MAFSVRRIIRKQVRTSFQSSLDSAAALPNSGLTFVDNSQGASAAISELSGVFDDAIEQLDLQGSLRGGLKKHLDSLDEEASKYANCGVSVHANLINWNPSFHEVEVVSLAWKCAAGVYKSDRQRNLSHNAFLLEELKFIRPSTSGTTKAVSFTRIQPENGTHPLLPALVIAIRGTENLVAHMVNLNGQPKTFDLSNICSTSPQIVSMKAHGGFLNGGEALLPQIRTELDRVCRDTPNLHVIFTGHSAGGAIASLLYLKIRSDAQDSYPNFTFSSITFGSPPIVSPTPGEHLLSPRSGLVLSIINEYDLVTRSDTSYVRSLIELFRSIHRLPPLLEGAEGIDRSSALQSEPDISSSSLKSQISFEKNEWALPSPEYYHVGDLILLRKKLVDDQLALIASTIRPEDFARMLFCRIEVHRRKEYEARLEFLLAGRFNGRSIW